MGLIKKVRHKAKTLLSCAARCLRLKSKQRLNQSETSSAHSKNTLSRTDACTGARKPWRKTKDRGDCTVSSVTPLRSDAETATHPGIHDENMKDPTWIFEGENRDDYTADDPKMVLAADGKKTCVGILPDYELSRQLQAAVVEHRKVKALETGVDDELDGLESEAGRIERAILGVQQVMSNLQDESTQEDLGRRHKLQLELAKLQGERGAVQSRQEKVHKRIDEMYTSLRHEHYQLFEKLDDILTASALLAPNDTNDPAAGSINGFADGVSQVALESPAAGNLQSDVGSTMTDLTLRRRLGVTNLKRTHSIKIDLNTLVSGEQEDIRSRDELLYNFRMERNALIQAEQDLEDRHETFDREADERDRRTAEGHAVETCTEFELHLLEKTGQLTRRVIEAEKAYEAAKTAAVALGVQLPGSDIESGFALRSDDGYRLSWEQDMLATTDRERVMRWLRTLPDAGGFFEEVDNDGPWEVELDEWDAKSVDISDSASMVAYGSTRRRIDKWFTTCQKAAQAISGQTERPQV